MIITTTAFLWQKFDHEKYVEDLEKIDYVNIGNESDINSTYEIFEKSYLEVVNKHIPLKKRKPVQNLGWYYIVHITESAVKVCSILAVTWFVGKYNIN
jgi:hypothetical protein